MSWHSVLASVFALGVLGGVAAEPVAVEPVWVEPERELWQRPPEASLGDILWNDQVIATQIAWACDAVESVCGRPFPRRPCWARPGTVPSLGDPETCLGQFERESWTVTLFPSAITRQRDSIEGGFPLDACHVRLVLLHEVVHAYDAGLHPGLFHEARRRTGGSEGLLSEGHAQHVTAQVAAASGQWTAFRELLTLVFCVPMANDPFEEERDLAAAGHCRYSWGRLFMEDAHRRGGRPFVEFLLDHPPEEPPILDDHGWWLSRRKRDMEALAGR